MQGGLFAIEEAGIHRPGPIRLCQRGGRGGGEPADAVLTTGVGDGTGYQQDMGGPPLIGKL